MHRRLICIALTLAAAVTVSFPSRGSSLDVENGLSSYVVVMKEESDPITIQTHLARYGIKPSFVYTSVIRGYAAKLSPALVEAISRDPEVQFVSADDVISATVQEDAAGTRRIDAAPAPSGGSGINVAVLDTGIDFLHPDLAENIAGVFDCVEGAHPYDVYGHGTHVAGIIAAVDNTIGVVGVAPQAKIWSIKVLGDLGYGLESTVLCGLELVHLRSPVSGTPDPIRVVNLSLGGYGTDDGDCGLSNADPMHRGICNVVDAGVTVVAAAGNDRANLYWFVPAAYDEVIAVTALADSDGRPCGSGPSTGRGDDDTFADFSNYARQSDVTHTVAAPGVNIRSTVPIPWGSYDSFSGTSMASPHVAGAVAVYLSMNPGASPSSVLTGLLSSAEYPNVNYQNECLSDVASHTANVLHLEGVIRLGAF